MARRPKGGDGGGGKGRKGDDLRDILVSDEELAPLVGRLHTDLVEAAATLTEDQVRYLVDLFYQTQEARKRSANQVRSGEEEPNRLLAFVNAINQALENRIALAMDIYTDAQPLGRWCKSIYGIDRVLAAAFMAHIDVTKAQTSGGVWRFAGLDPTSVWKKGEKRPYNAELKTLCWKMADVQWRFHNRPQCYYGRLIAERKAMEESRNFSGANAALAASELQARTFRDLKTKAHYLGKNCECEVKPKHPHLPPGRIHLRALRWGSKLFLSHFWQVGRELKGLPHPAPFAVEWLGHAHVMEPPNWPMPKA